MCLAFYVTSGDDCGLELVYCVCRFFVKFVDIVAVYFG